MSRSSSVIFVNLINMIFFFKKIKVIMTIIVMSNLLIYWAMVKYEFVYIAGLNCENE